MLAAGWGRKGWHELADGCETCRCSRRGDVRRNQYEQLWPARAPADVFDFNTFTESRRTGGSPQGASALQRGGAEGEEPGPAQNGLCSPRGTRFGEKEQPKDTPLTGPDSPRGGKWEIWILKDLFHISISTSYLSGHGGRVASHLHPPALPALHRALTGGRTAQPGWRGGFRSKALKQGAGKADGGGCCLPWCMNLWGTEMGRPACRPPQACTSIPVLWGHWC